MVLFPDNESQRLKVLYEYAILDTPPEAVFDELVQLAADLCETPIAFMSLVDAEREWFKSKIGIQASEVPRHNSFGGYTLLEREILIVPDTSQDPRFAPIPDYRFYAGVPLVTTQGLALGSFGVIDLVPRNLNLKQQVTLQKLSRQAIRYIELQLIEVQLFVNHPHPMWIYDLETLQFLDVNQAAITHYGYSRWEFLQRQITDILHPQDIPRLQRHFAPHRDDMSCSGEWRHRLKDGRVIIVEVFTHVINYHGHHGCLVNIRDITQQKQVEATLKESEARFKVISQAIPVPLVISRLSDGLILYANQEFSQTFGIPLEDLSNHQITELYCHPACRQEISLALDHYGFLHDYESQMRRIDGTCFWAIASLQYLAFNGEMAILKVLYDITDRKNTVTKLQEQNCFLQNVFENIPLMIKILDHNGKPQWVNQEWERVLGWTFEDFQDQDLLEVLYPQPDDRQYMIDFIQSADRIWGDFRTQIRSGQTIDTTWTNVKLANGQIIGIGQDITKRKQAERILQAQAEREQLMRTVSERIRQSLNLSDILSATVREVRDLLQVDRVIVFKFAPDMSGTIVAESVQPGWTAAFGQEIHDTCFQTGGVGEYAQGRRRAISDIYTAGLSDCHINLLTRFEVKGNLVVPILLEISGENSSSRLWGLLIAHQCSQPRDWEEDQLDLLEQLTVQIAIAIQQSSIFQQSQSELHQRQKAELELRDALTEKEFLLKEIHHRVKNNLQIISSLLQLQSYTVRDPEVIKALRESQNRIESMSLIHKNLYTAPNIGNLDVVDYINSLAASILASYQIGPGRIALQTQMEPVSLSLDQAVSCGLIINELISNALKHAFPNEQVGIISITLCNTKSNIQITIQDNGIGLPINFNFGNTDSLGLSLVYDLVTEQLEGNITIERNQGTAFKIEFPQLTLCR
jgi:PAS domain S-box-containing protein